MRKVTGLLPRMGLSMCLVLAAPAFAGPTSVLYVPTWLNAPNNGALVAIQGDQVLWDVPTASSGYEHAIAVASTARTLGNRYSGSQGSEYTLGSLQPTGAHYAYPGTVHDDLNDGTTNGESNFAISFYEGAVYQFNNAWAAPRRLFSIASHGTGITYDGLTDTLWTSGRANLIENRALDGSVLSSFSATIPAGRVTTGLALDPADHSLWLLVGGSWTAAPLLQQYSTAGELRDQVWFPQLTGRSVMGSEFKLGEFSPPVPEPQTYALMLAGLGLLGIAARRRQNG